MPCARELATKRWTTKLADDVLNAALDSRDDASTADHICAKLPMTLPVTSYKAMR